MSKEALYFTSAVGFEAARKVTLLPEGHRSRREHGHSFVAKVRADAISNFALSCGSEVSALREKLALAVMPLDYQNLNNLLDQPTDENLARWIWRKIDLPGTKSIGLQSTTDEGVDLDAESHVHVWRRYRFEAAHQLPNVPFGHKCGRMHGHGFEVNPSSATTCYEQAIAKALREELGGSRKSEKTLMRWTGARGRTVKNWISGLRGPNGIHLIALMRNSDTVLKAVLMMARRRDSLGPDGILAARGHLVELLALLDSAVEKEE